jgi:hydrogenase expression/formation protein HypC
MCLAVPVRVSALLDDQWVEIEVGGIHSRTSIALIDEVAVGDYVIVHAGYAIARLDVREAEKTLALFDEIAAQMRRPNDALHPRIP